MLFLNNMSFRRSCKPDVLVEPDIHNFILNEDAILNKAIELLEQN
jgi:hypothetical protein